MLGKAESPEYPFGLCRDDPVPDDPVQNHGQELARLAARQAIF